MRKTSRPALTLNNSGWGRGGGDDRDGDRSRTPSRGEGPPDLEELWRDLNRRLSRLFGRNGGGDGVRPPTGPDRRGSIGVLVAAAAVVLIWACTGIYIVQEGQVAVVTTFGRYAATTGPGFQWRAPWPIQAHEIVDVFLLRKVEIGTRSRGQQERLKEALMLTDDENIVDMQFEVQYRIKDSPEGARDFLFGSRFGKDRDAGGVVSQAAESAMREVVGRRKMDDILGGSRQQIADDVRARMQEMLDRYATGILVSAVAIQNAQPPEQVQAAFDDAVKAGQDRDRQINEGQAYANDVVPKARGSAASMAQQAEAYRVRVTETAEGDAARFRQVLAEYSKAPDVTRERMYLETMQEIFANTSKVLIDARSGANLLNLPLDKLLQQQAAPGGDATARAGAPAPSAASPSASAPVVVPAPTDAMSGPGSDSRARDGQRLRDREAR